MGAMMQRLDVDPIEVARRNNGQSLRQARALCLNCPTTEICDAYLAGTNTAARPADFCPNHSMFRATRAR
jgi:hypothetical protein